MFCGGGGAAKGIHDAGFNVVGIDINSQPDYPYEFLQCDVFDLPLEFFEEFDFIWSSPPCQAYSYSTKWNRNLGKKYPDLVQRTRELLDRTKKPYVIENVPGAPIRKDLMLCGDMWDMDIIRHRHFEIEGFHVVQLKHRRHKGMVANGTKIGIFTGNKQNDRMRRKYTIAGHQDGTIKQWQDAIEIDWIRQKHVLAQCVPPRYSRYIASHLTLASSV